MDTEVSVTIIVVVIWHVDVRDIYASVVGTISVVLAAAAAAAVAAAVGAADVCSVRES